MNFFLGLGHVLHSDELFRILDEVEDMGHGENYALITSFILDESQYHFHGLVMKITEPRFGDIRLQYSCFFIHLCPVLS